MKIFKGILFTLIGLAAVLAIIGFLLPDSRHVERSIVIDAPPATVFSVLNGFTVYNKWSPWFELDPAATYVRSGPPAGVGAKQAWSSKLENVGSGSQEIVESVPNTSIKQALRFEGFEPVSMASFTLAPEGKGTKVTWGYDVTMSGNILYRYMGLMFDKMVGGDYERGLPRLKALVESLPKVDYSALKVEVAQVQPIAIAFVPGSSAFEPKAIGEALGAAYAGKIGPFLKANNLKQAGAPLAIYDNCEPTGSTCTFRAGIPIDRADVPVAESSEVKVGQTYAGKALKITYTGPYAAMQPTYDMASAYIAANGYVRSGPPMEQYMSDPGNTPEAELVTLIVLPVK